MPLELVRPGELCVGRCEIPGRDHDNSTRVELTCAQRKRILWTWQVLDHIEAHNQVEKFRLQSGFLIGNEMEIEVAVSKGLLNVDTVHFCVRKVITERTKEFAFATAKIEYLLRSGRFDY